MKCSVTFILKESQYQTNLNLNDNVFTFVPFLTEYFSLLSHCWPNVIPTFSFSFQGKTKSSVSRLGDQTRVATLDQYKARHTLWRSQSQLGLLEPIKPIANAIKLRNKSITLCTILLSEHSFTLWHTRTSHKSIIFTILKYTKFCSLPYWLNLLNSRIKVLFRG